MKIDWKLFKKAFPFICYMCKSTHWEMRDICEICGAKETIRKTIKKDYKLKQKNKYV